MEDHNYRNSSQTQRPAKARRAPRVPRNRAAHTQPTEEVMLERVEKIPVPIMRSMLERLVWCLMILFNKNVDLHQESRTE